MMLRIPGILSADRVALCHDLLRSTDWADGKETAGYQAAPVKNNAQLPPDGPVARQLAGMIVAALERVPLFVSAALPLKVYPPMINRYGAGERFGTHVDTAVRQVPGTPHRVRSDLAATLFLTAPEDYDGGELVVQNTFGMHAVKLPAGDMVLYPGSSLHEVRPVTRGVRLAAVTWIQSMIREDERRTMLYDLDTAIQHIAVALPGNAAVVQLTGVYHNLLRTWADA